ncbi:LOW QUALITY PROTEIN: histo-blood group ABO system transferase [Aquarana catesbeiana]|uniref:LOW QUALITY PROTEIN: histo-blood group ABO system transferase n=1 Tax=Aquarana catesbeiana TaxID=8400 RepID=UPI003CCA52D0
MRNIRKVFPHQSLPLIIVMFFHLLHPFPGVASIYLEEAEPTHLSLFIPTSDPFTQLFMEANGSLIQHSLISDPSGSQSQTSCTRDLSRLQKALNEMSVEIYEKKCGKKRYCLLLYLSILLCSIFWYTHRHSQWDTSASFFCNLQGSTIRVTNTSRLGLMKSVTLHRMLYEKPDAMKPPRIDVLTITPWFAPIVWNGTYNLDILNAQFHQRKVHIGLTVFAIKKYSVFVQTFIESAEKFFMVGHKVTYYIFTDRVSDIPAFTLGAGRKLVTLEVPSYQRWQDVSMRRMEMIRDQSHQRFIHEVDYLVCVDVDMRFSDEVGVEILGGVFGTLHPGFYSASREQFTYERRPESTAYIPTDEGDFYYAGGFFGGTVEEVYRLTNFCYNAMMVDKEKQMEAIWHDESYLNKYFLYQKPTKILSPEYLWDNNFTVPGFLKRRRFVAVPKNHNAIRSKRALQGVSGTAGKFYT